MYLAHKFPVMEENKDDGSGGSGAGDDAAKAAAAAQTQQMELLTKSVGLLAEGLQKMEGNQASIIETLAKVTDQSKKEVKDDIKEKFGDDVDFEQLDRKDFAALIIESVRKQFQAEMTKLVGDVDTKVQNLASNFESKNANEQITKTASDNPDFWEWSGEIKALLGENPTISVKRAYTLAKSENPKKAEELDKKYKPAEKEKKQPSFLGLTPTSSLSSRESGAVKMTPKEAAEKAFDTVMADLGDVIKNGDMKIA